MELRCIFDCRMLVIVIYGVTCGVKSMDEAEPEEANDKARGLNGQISGMNMPPHLSDQCVPPPFVHSCRRIDMLALRGVVHSKRKVK
jgi:hypothetical protein